MSEHALTGIKEMTHDAYLASAGVSRSMLEDIAPPKTPMHFWGAHVAKKVVDKETPAKRFGTIFHAATLTHDTVLPFHAKPEGMKFNTKAGMEWEAEHFDKPIVSHSEAQDIAGMREAIWRHRKAKQILAHSDFERSVFADDKGLLLKSRFDALPTSGNLIFDLKTCESADLDSVEKAMLDYGLFRQAAFYLRVAELLGLDRELMVFCFVEKSFPYAVACYTPADVVLDAGRMMVSRDLQLLRNCYERNEWPGYSPEIEPCALPKWAMKGIEELA